MHSAYYAAARSGNCHYCCCNATVCHDQFDTRQAFELPTGGAAEMNAGENIMYFARKEQCLALGTQLRTKFKPRIEDYKIYRIYPGGDTEFLHPKDGVFPEKCNEGRAMVGHTPRSIGANPNPASLKFSGKATHEA